MDYAEIHDEVIFFPDDDIGIAVLSNEDNSPVKSIASDIAALL